MFKKIIIPLLLLILAVILLILLYPSSREDSSIENQVVNVSEEASSSSFTESEITSYNREEIEEYLKNNISALSPEEAVLGGTWYVTSVEFLSDYSANIYYEDGHIARKLFVSFSYNESSGVIINELKSISNDLENKEDDPFITNPIALPEEEIVFCTMDAKMCPDGSYVGRVAPDCEFAPCP